MQIDQIQAYLATKLPHVDGLAVSGLHRIPGGASRETWSFDASWRQEGADVSKGFILRRDPDASLLVTERDLEYRVMDGVAGSGVPVPKVCWLESDSTVLDRPFFAMERLDRCETSPSQL